MLPPLRPLTTARSAPARRAAPGGGSEHAPPAPAVPVPADGALSQGDLEARIAAALREPLAEEAALERTREAFDLTTRVRAETDRETTVLRELAMDEMKRDDELLKKWIELI